jgi:DNA-binding NarL/FixJ family response regulator
LRSSRGEIREHSNQQEGRPNGNMQRLLLVEDRSLFRQGLALLLEWRTGLGSHQAASLAEAQRILSDAKVKPACAVVDVDMSNGDGIELVQQLHELPVLALMAGRSVERRAQALEAGADEVLPLSVPADRIVDTVRRLVGG